MQSNIFRPARAICAALALIALGPQSSIADPASATTPVYKNASAPLEARVADLMSKLTQDEKLGLLSTKNYINECLPGEAIPRLDITALSSANAAQGIGGGKSTNFPMEVNMACTWDTDLVHADAVALGEESNLMGRNLIYAPLINIQRTPQGGRFFENFSEDPYLVSRFAYAYITGMQSRNVACCPKHFFGNDQEYGRHGFSSEMDERTMHEVYLAPFHAALVDAHAWAVMSSFNKVNGVWMADNKQYIAGMLDTDWGWDGVVIGDWGSPHDTALSLNAGLDQEIAWPNILSPAKVTAALAAGTVTQATVDEAVRRNVRLYLRTGMANDPPPADPPADDDPAHVALALRTAEEGIVLLKNDHGALPLDRKRVKTIAVIGPNAKDTQLGGRWSGEMHPYFMVNVLDGVTAAAGSGVAVTFSQGCNRNGDTPDSMIQDAVTAASKADVVIVVVGTDQNLLGEELDPPSLYLPGAQDKLVAAVAAANKNTIVVLNNGMPLLMDKWLDAVPAVVEAWYPGQMTGKAVAEILFGDINPSGHLTCTIAAKREDYSDWPNYPGTKDGKVLYAEGVYVGYRHFDKANITPLYPFGYGLSYTTFSMRRISVPRRLAIGRAGLARVDVKNTGPSDGDEVVQLYVRPINPLIDRPLRELEGFCRVHVARGKTVTATIPIDADAFRYWDVTSHNWRTDPGDYAIDIGDSERNILATATIHVQ